MLRIFTIALSLLVTGCSLQAPPYQVSLENVQTIKRTKVEPMNVGAIIATKKLNSISLRGSSMNSPVNKSYGDYISTAVEEELKLAKLWSPVSSTVITGTVLTNDIDVSGFSEGSGEISVNFIVTKNNIIIFDKVISAAHTFDSSFMGGIAIPNGQTNYVNLVQKLIKNLFENKEFISAIKQ